MNYRVIKTGKKFAITEKMFIMHLATGKLVDSGITSAGADELLAVWDRKRDASIRKVVGSF